MKKKDSKKPKLKEMKAMACDAMPKVKSMIKKKK
jgi:hypothetical protein